MEVRVKLHACISLHDVHAPLENPLAYQRRQIRGNYLDHDAQVKRILSAPVMS